MFFFRLALAIVLVYACVAQDEQKSDKSDFKRSFGKDCDNYYSTRCLKLDIVEWVDKLNKKEDIGLFSGVSIVREDVSARSNNEDIFADLARDFPNNPDSRLDVFLLKKVQDFLSSHSLKLNLYNSDDSAGTARRKGGGKKGDGGMGMILAAAAMMKSTYFALAMGALAALAGGGGATTYEVVSKPIYTHSSSHSTGHEDYHAHGHGRSFEAPLPLGLRPEYNPA